MMIFNYVKVTFRNLKKNKFHSIINVIGLSLGMACCFLTLLYVWHESTYDTFHKDGDRIYRIEYSLERASVLRMGRIPPAVAPFLVDYFPEIESASRFYPRELSVEITETQQQFEMEDVFFVDSSALNVFKFDFLHGDALRALHQPDAVVISHKAAERLFGTTNVIGKPLRLAGEDGFRITGVVESWPDNAHLEFNLLLPFESMIKVEPEHARKNMNLFMERNMTATHSYTYVKLKEHQEPEKVNARFASFIEEKGNEHIKDTQSLNLIPVRDIHLHTEEGGPKPPGNPQYLYLFLFVGALTLLIACINFINLSTASSMKRAKEVGVRKVLGAQRSMLVSQFLGESIFLSFISFLLSIGITLLALPYLNRLTGIEVPFVTVMNPSLVTLFSVIFLLTGVLAGLYPAFFVSRFKPVVVLKGSTSSNQRPRKDYLRKGLITFQFLAAIAFIAGSFTLYLQNRYLRSQPLGFDQELVLSLPLNSANNLNAILRPGDASMRQRMNTFDESMLSNPKIKAVTQCSQLPGLGAIGRKVWTDKVPQSENFFPRVLSVDYDFSETFNLEILAGRDFDASFGTDHISSFLINEKTMERLEWASPEEAVGQEMDLEGKKGMVVGVLKDFHFQNLRTEISPLILEVRPGAFGYFALAIENGNLPETLRYIESKWTAAFPEKVFEYTFLDDRINDTYQLEKRLADMIGYFALLAILISCFGLFGLAALMTQQRFKEIGIRKVLGASVVQILRLISSDFLILIAIAMVIATPLTWYFLKDWLADFAYRIEFPWWASIVSGLTVMFIAFLTISAQSVKAAISNPVDAIRNE